MATIRGEHRRRDLKASAVGNLLGDRLRAMGYDAKIREHTAPLVWASLVGPQIAAATEVDRVRDGVLYVHTRSAMWSHELTFHKLDILRRLNERIGARAGEPIIKDLRFQARGLQRKRRNGAGEWEPEPALHPTPDELDDMDLSTAEIEAIETGVAPITDEALRDRLRLLRIADAKLRTWRLDNGWTPCAHCGDIAPPAYPVRDDASGAPDCPRCRLAGASLVSATMTRR